MASTLARRVASLTRLSISNSSSPASLISRRGLSASADHHGSTRVHVWQQPTNPGNWIEEEFVIVSLAGWGLTIYGAYKFFTGGKKKDGEKVVEASN